MNEEPQNTTLKQKKIALAQSEHAPVIIELMKDCLTPVHDLIGKTEWDTVVNAITLDVQGKMITTMVDHLEAIRKGKLHNPQL